MDTEDDEISSTSTSDVEESDNTSVDNNGSNAIHFSERDEVKNVYNLRGFISAVNKNGTYDVTYHDGQWDKNVAAEQLRAITRESKPRRRKVNQTWTMVPVVNSSWEDTAKLNNANVIQGKRRRPNCSVYHV
jgi:hypothetical protein